MPFRCGGFRDRWATRLPIPSVLIQHRHYPVLCELRFFTVNFGYNLNIAIAFLISVPGLAAVD